MKSSKQVDLLKFLMRLGSKKIQVLLYLLENKDSQNSLNTSIREIADKSGTSQKTVFETVKILKEEGFLSVKGSVYTLSFNLKGAE